MVKLREPQTGRRRKAFLLKKLKTWRRADGDGRRTEEEKVVVLRDVVADGSRAEEDRVIQGQRRAAEGDEKRQPASEHM